MGTALMRWSDHSSSVSASFYQFWENELFTDVTVSVPGGPAIGAHRAVLAARCAGLRPLLAARQPAEPPLLLLRGVSARQLRLLLQLLYAGRVTAERPQLAELLELCRELGVEGLDADSLVPLEDGDGPTAGTEPAAAERSDPPPCPASGPPAELRPAADSGPGCPPAGCPEDQCHLNDSPLLAQDNPAGDAGGAAAFLQLSRLLETLDRRQLLQLRQRAHQIMHPDCTAWLPDELMVNILCRLPPRGLLAAAAVCRRWRALARDDAVWRHCLRRAGASPVGLRSRRECISYLGWTELPLSPPRRLKGHDSVIRCMAVDGDRIVTGSSDKTVGVWSAASGHLTGRLRGESEVTCVQVEGDMVVVAARDCTIGVWDAATSRRRHRLAGHGGIVWSVALCGVMAASGSDDKTVRVWDVAAGHQLQLLQGHDTVVRAVCFDGRLVISGDDAGSVRVWDVVTSTEETVWQAGSRYVMVLQHAHGVVVSGHGDGAIYVWDVSSRQLRHELRAHTGWVTDVCVSPTGLLLSGCKDGSALLWGLSSGALLHRLSGSQGHRQRVTAVRLLPGLAVTGARDGRVKLWDTASGALLRDLVTPELSGGPVKHVWASSDRLICSVQNNASDRPQLLILEMALPAPDGV